MKLLKSTCLLIFVCVMGCAPKESSPYQTEMILLIDRTDPLPVYPDHERLCKLLNVSKNSWQGAKLTIGWISDQDIDREETVTLEAESELLGNAGVREGKVNCFKNSVKEMLNHFRPPDSMVCPRSIIYRRLAHSLERLKTSSAQNRLCLVYSNLMEHSSLDFYDLKVLALPDDTLQKFLEKEVQMSELLGVRLYLLFNPGSYKANITYMTIASFYKRWFESKGAVVEIAAQLP